VVEAALTPEPMLVVVSVTAKPEPGAATAGGLLTAVTARSTVEAEIWMVRPVAARQLLVSLDSSSWARSSAQAMRK
jgi:hypothetical protein